MLDSADMKKYKYKYKYNWVFQNVLCVDMLLGLIRGMKVVTICLLKFCAKQRSDSPILDAKFQACCCSIADFRTI